MDESTKNDFYNKILLQRKGLNAWVVENYIAEKDDLKDLYKTLVYETIKNIIRDIDFIEFLCKGDNFEDEIFYPVRSIFENCLRIRYMKNISKNQRQELSLKEFLRRSKRFYDVTKDQKFEEIFNEISNSQCGDIKQFEIKNDSFPKIRDMLTALDSEKANEIYFLYQDLCESSHGKVMSRKRSLEFFGFISMAQKSLENLIITMS